MEGFQRHAPELEMRAGPRGAWPPVPAAQWPRRGHVRPGPRYLALEGLRVQEGPRSPGVLKPCFRWMAPLACPPPAGVCR